MLQLLTAAAFSLLALAAVVTAGPTLTQILAQEDNPYTGGESWNWGYESEDGTKRRESGKKLPDGTIEVQGAWSYTDPDGKQHEVAYKADKSGYRQLPPRRICKDRPDTELCTESLQLLTGQRRRRKIFIRVLSNAPLALP